MMAPRGRPPSAKTLVDRQLGRNIQNPILPAGESFIIPNHSGDHSAGTTGTPVNPTDLVNKEYVDNVSIQHDSLTHLDYADAGHYGNVLVGDGADGDSYVYFYEGAPTGVYLRWNHTAGDFNLNKKLRIIKSDYSDIQLQATGVNSNARFVLQNDAIQWTTGVAGNDCFIISDDTAGEQRFKIDTSGNVDILSGTLDMNTHKILGVVDPTSDQEVATKKYVDDNASGTIWPMTTTAKFDITTNTEVISAEADKKIKILGISIHNNDSDGADDEFVRLQDGSGGTDLYGGSTGGIYLPGRGGVFTLPLAPVPYFTLTTNTALYINPTNSKRVSGIVLYIKEA